MRRHAAAPSRVALVVSLAGANRAPADPPLDVPALLRRLLQQDPGRPRLTWYGADGERVELSAKVLDNWVAKTANLLVEELDAGPGTRVAILMPAHWRSACWMLATWSVGACVVVGASDHDVDVVVSSQPRWLHDPRPVLGAAARKALMVAVALPALATTFGAELPPGAIDAAVDVRSHGDVFLPLATPAPDDPALQVTGQAPIVHGELMMSALRSADEAKLSPHVRLLTGAGPDDAIAALLAPLARLGSVVLHHDLDALDPQERQRLQAQEGITDVR
jgi:uncharacterized protein (TIGR03089 family)